MKPARIIVICIAAVSAIGLALVVRAMGSPSGEPTAVATAAPVEVKPMAKVLVAARDLEPGTRLADADLEWKEWPVDQVIPAFITDGTVPVTPAAAPAEAKAEGAVARVARGATDAVTGGAKADYFGSVVREPISAGEPITSRKIVRAGDSGYMAAYLEPGMRAMAIRVTVETAAGGFILPGDRVDVLQSHQADASANGGHPGFIASMLLRNIRVLAIDQASQPQKAAQAMVGAVATLEVAAADAEVLARAKAVGEVILALRPYGDAGEPSGRVAVGGGPAGTVRITRGGQSSDVMVAQ